jgi:Ca2+-transporting ATPase
LVVEQVYTGDEIHYCQAEGFNESNLQQIFRIGTLCNNARLKEDSSFTGRMKQIKDSVFGNDPAAGAEIIGDPTEGALLLAGRKAGLNKSRLESRFSELLEVPFTSNRKRMSKIGKKGGQYDLYIKGAPEIIVDRCQYYSDGGEIKELTRQKREEIKKVNGKLARQGLRVLGFAHREIEGELDRDNLAKYERKLVFVGLVGLLDPPRPEARQAIKACKQAGIIPKLVTGDHKETAVAIAEKLNLLQPGDEIVTGLELQQMDESELSRRIEDISVLARVSPEDKLRVVKALQQKNHIVGMTGDGINDAPAIKEADIGIAMGEQGTDVTQEASSLILADDNFATIVAAIEEGRAIYDNIRKFIRYLLSCNIGEILTMFLASVFALPLPLVPIQILWVNLVTDGLPALALGVDQADDDIMNRPPREPEESVFSRGLKWKILGQGVLIGLGTLFVFLLGLQVSDSLLKARTMAFTNLVMVQLFFVFSCRSEQHSLLRMNPISNLYLVGAALLSFGLHWLVLYHPFFQELFKTTMLDRGEWGVILLVSAGSTLVVEIIQFIVNLVTTRVSVIKYQQS